MRWLTVLALLVLTPPLAAQQADGNRLAYLDEVDPYYPHRDFPRLTTPQWVGDKDVECVVILAIDDMRDTKRYETYLRPILRRLKDIDGRAPLSIMTCSVDPKDPQLQDWLKEGLSLECHTVDHPCPFFKGGFAKAKDTYDRCVDLMHAIPGNKPVAFRVPCCDSLNTPSPRFWAEIFGKTTAKGNFLSIDSSVFNVFTSADPELPRAAVLDDQGQERFKRYLPADRKFVNTIENYPYPYVIGRLCWEFPCVTPSDWSAQHLQKPNNPNTVRDFKAALDCVVAKKGVFCLVFHPHGWIGNDQVVELIDHAVTRHGKKVKFLNFREAQERLDRNWLHGRPLRQAGGDNKAKFPTTRVLSIDGRMELIISPRPGQEGYAIAKRSKGAAAGSPVPFTLPPGGRLADASGRDAGLRFVDLDGDGKLDIVFSNEKEYGVYLFTDMEHGWSKKVMAGRRGDKDALPMISRDGTNNGCWAHSGHLWWSNEDTMLMKDHVDRRSRGTCVGSPVTKSLTSMASPTA